MSVNSKKARLVLVDDHDLARAGLRKLLSDEPSVDIVGEASCGEAAVALCERVRPDLVLMDVRMPNMDGLAATRVIKRCQPGTSVLMVTMHEDPDYLLEALRAGAAGYVLKGASGDELVSAVLRVLSGDSPLDSNLAAGLLRRLVHERGQAAPPSEEPAERPPENRPPPVPLADPLTSRELEVLGYLAQGHTNPKIAEILTISPGTVKRHVEHIIAKMGVSDRTQAAVKAYELRLIAAPGS